MTNIFAGSTVRSDLPQMDMIAMEPVLASDDNGEQL
jgi:hypothetical protein